MAGKAGCGLLLAVLFCAAAVSRAPFVVFLLAVSYTHLTLPTNSLV